MYTQVHISFLESGEEGWWSAGRLVTGGHSSRVARLTLLVTHSVRFYDTVDIANIPPDRLARCGGEQQTRLESVRRGADGPNRRWPRRLASETRVLSSFSRARPSTPRSAGPYHLL